MNDSVILYYLREDVYFEPLFNHWYAWPYLLAPVQGARHTVNTHQRIMKSFVNNYKLHILACKEPGMAGGDFLDCTEEQVEDIKRLIGDIDTECSDLVELSKAVAELDELIRSHTSGESIEPLYKNIPEALKGYVELFFDMEHNPSYRFFESLLYRSKYNKPELQSVSFGILSKVKERPFVLSTPRLPDENHIHIDMQYNSDDLHRLLQARDIPMTLAEIEDMMARHKVEGGFEPLELFTLEEPKATYKPVTEGVRLQYTGHAGFMVETADLNILIDPVIASRDLDNPDHMISFSELPEKIDYICITHSHQDHANIETLLQLRHKTNKVLVPKSNGGTLADPSLRLMLQQFGFNVVEMDELDAIDVKDGRIMSLPFMGEHGDLNIRTKAAWYFELHGKKHYFGADSSNLDPAMYQHIHRVIGDIDILAIGMECVGAPYTWLYGALHTKRVSKSIKNSRRLNGSDSEQAMNMVNTFKPSQVYVYALGLEACYKYFMGIDYDDESEQIVQSNKMVKDCHALGLVSQAMNGSQEIHIR